MAGYRAMAEQFLRSKGLNDYAVAGILGNWMVESSFNPSARNANEGAVGFAQWEGGRRTALQHWALTHHGADETDAQSQLEFFWHELTTSYSGVLSQLKHVTSAGQAAAIFDGGYEVSSGSTRQQRINYASQFYSGKGPNPTYTGEGATSSGGGGTGGTGGGGGQQHMSASDYSGIDSLGSLLNSIPELRALVDQAVAHNWSADKFQNAVEDSKWYKSNSASARAVITQRANDPKSYQESLNNATNHILDLAHQVGMPVSRASAQNIANAGLMSGNASDQTWLTQQLARHHDYSGLHSTDGMTGGMANTIQQLNQLQSDYGFKWTPAQQAEHAQAILTGRTTIDTYRQNLIAWSKSAFPSLAPQIDAGQTVKQLADPYIQSMSRLLEVDPGTLDAFNPTIRKAMQGTTAPGSKPGPPTATPLWQFEQQVRSDPRWATTQNATDTMSSALVQLGSTFGFGPAG